MLRARHLTGLRFDRVGRRGRAPGLSGYRKSDFQHLILPITASDITFATHSLFNCPIDIISPAGQLLAYKEIPVSDELEHQRRVGQCVSRA